MTNLTKQEKDFLDCAISMTGQTNEIYFDDVEAAIYTKKGGWNLPTLVGLFGSLNKKGLLHYDRTDQEYGRLYYWDMLVYHEDVPEELHMDTPEKIEAWLNDPNRKTAIEIQGEF